METEADDARARYRGAGDLDLIERAFSARAATDERIECAERALASDRMNIWGYLALADLRRVDAERIALLEEASRVDAEARPFRRADRHASTVTWEGDNGRQATEHPGGGGAGYTGGIGGETSRSCGAGGGGGASWRATENGITGLTVTSAVMTTGGGAARGAHTSITFEPLDQ